MEKTTPTLCGTAIMARFRVAPAVAILAAGLLSACAMQPSTKSSQASNEAATPQIITVPPSASAPELVATGPVLTGTASWYRAGRGLHRTCSGQIFTGNAMTAASHSIPLGTQVRVALVGDESHSIIVRVNDCMPREGRILDLSHAAAEQLGIISSGVAEVSVTPVVMMADNR